MTIKFTRGMDKQLVICIRKSTFDFHAASTLFKEWISEMFEGMFDPEKFTPDICRLRWAVLEKEGYSQAMNTSDSSNDATSASLPPKEAWGQNKPVSHSHSSTSASMKQSGAASSNSLKVENLDVVARDSSPSSFPTFDDDSCSELDVNDIEGLPPMELRQPISNQHTTSSRSESHSDPAPSLATSTPSSFSIFQTSIRDEYNKILDETRARLPSIGSDDVGDGECPDDDVPEPIVFSPHVQQDEAGQLVWKFQADYNSLYDRMNPHSANVPL